MRAKQHNLAYSGMLCVSADRGEDDGGSDRQDDDYHKVELPA